jgi:Mo-co oxidoreductase dimerisation domain
VLCARQYLLLCDDKLEVHSDAFSFAVCVHHCTHTTCMQPNTIKWNLLGMMNNSYYRVKLNVLEPQSRHHTDTINSSAGDAPVIEFLHPVSQTGESNAMTASIKL